MCEMYIMVFKNDSVVIFKELTVNLCFGFLLRVSNTDGSTIHSFSANK